MTLTPTLTGQATLGMYNSCFQVTLSLQQTLTQTHTLTLTLTLTERVRREASQGGGRVREIHHILFTPVTYHMVLDTIFFVI